MNQNIITGLANEIPSVTQRSSAWLRLAEYGDWPHSQGLQRFTRQSAEQLVKNFKSLRGRLARKFGGLPVYIGHPDDDHFAGQSGHADTRAYAWIDALDARPDGLYVLPRWSDAGQNLLRNAFYKFLSPRWAMKPLGDGVFEPVRLISVGLTNQPNIPGDAIANEAQREAMPAAVEDADWTNVLANERQERIAVILDNAVLTGVIAPNERERWRAGLSADLELGLSELKELRPALKTIASTEGLALRQASNAARGGFLSQVQDRIARTGEPFAEAWKAVKQERPDLLDELNTF
ncbi:phage protease [Cerasicoccus fimbriatus]|uniref:phage protease n=1 Tax=Cerasicoccus fimbriatus TaxID=3014554 RepID=UPI0022B5A0A8|nr:phage protease [Cerasicoccus sp. TK19100]